MISKSVVALLLATLIVTVSAAPLAYAEDQENMMLAWGGDGGADDQDKDDDGIPDQWEEVREQGNPDDPSWDEIILPPKPEENKEYTCGISGCMLLSETTSVESTTNEDCWNWDDELGDWIRC